MPKQIVIAEQHRIAAVFAEDQIQELIVASGQHQVGDVHLGIVENVLPSIDAAFVNIGNPERNGFIHVTDLGPIRLKRTSVPISELVTPQQKVLVQVMKEPTGNKGPRLTGKISFPGRYLVLVPYGRGVSLSSRIRDEEERNRLRSLAILIKPPQMGLVVRTEADGIPEDSIIQDLEILKKQWEQIQQEQQSSRAPSLLNRDDDFIQRVLRDAYSSDVNRIVTDSNAGTQGVRQHLQNWNKGQMPPGVLVDTHPGPAPILEYFRVHAEIRQALRPRVDLPSGGYIIIEPTEALTVVDVNSGSFTRSATSRETVLWTNCEAATEISRQLRLRNIAGVIVVDFIDMDTHRDQLQVLEHFNKALRADKSRPQVAQLSELGLVELTRKRQGQSLYEVFGRPCPTCDGLGLLVHLPGAHSEADALNAEDVAAAQAGIGESLGDPRSLDRNGGGRRRRTYGNRRSEEPDDNETPVTSRRSSRNAPPATKLGRDKPLELVTSSTSPVIKQKDTQPEQPDPGIAKSQVTREVPDKEVVTGDAPKPRESRHKVVTVEMTPLQQQVYGEMGISPLVLLPEPPTPSRHLTVQVLLPGEAPPTSPNLDSSDLAKGSESTEAQAVVPNPKQIIRRSAVTTPEATTPEATADEASPAPVIDLREADFPQTKGAAPVLAKDLPPADILEETTEEEPSDAAASEEIASAVSELQQAPDVTATQAETNPITPQKQSPAASRRRRSRST